MDFQSVYGGNESDTFSAIVSLLIYIGPFLIMGNFYYFNNFPKNIFKLFIFLNIVGHFCSNFGKMLETWSCGQYDKVSGDFQLGAGPKMIEFFGLCLEMSCSVAIASLFCCIRYFVAENKTQWDYKKIVYFVFVIFLIFNYAIQFFGMYFLSDKLIYFQHYVWLSVVSTNIAFKTAHTYQFLVNFFSVIVFVFLGYFFERRNKNIIDKEIVLRNTSLLLCLSFVLSHLGVFVTLYTTIDASTIYISTIGDHLTILDLLGSYFILVYFNKSIKGNSQSQLELSSKKKEKSKEKTKDRDLKSQSLEVKKNQPNSLSQSLDSKAT